MQLHTHNINSSSCEHRSSIFVWSIARQLQLPLLLCQHSVKCAARHSIANANRKSINRLIDKYCKRLLWIKEMKPPKLKINLNFFLKYLYVFNYANYRNINKIHVLFILLIGVLTGLISSTNFTNANIKQIYVSLLSFAQFYVEWTLSNTYWMLNWIKLVSKSRFCSR